jgi:hypothetical protein
MRTVYIIFGFVIAASVAASFVFPEVVFVDRFASGIATDSFGILLTLVFVHRFLERQERSRRLRGSIGALRRGSRALAGMTDAWATLIKGSMQREPADPVHGIEDLFAPHFVENLTYVDPRRMRYVDGHDPEPWVRWALRRLLDARAALNEIMVAHGGSLDPGYIEAVDEVVDDAFLQTVEAMVNADVDAREWRVRMNASRAARETHFARLAATIRLHNELARAAATVRSRRIAPRTGSVGMELPLDHDLRFETELPRRWWALPPGVGVLRSEQERTPSETPT